MLQVDCPECFHRICLVPFPTEAETRAAARAGNEEALRNEQTDQEIEAGHERWKASTLKSPEGLPPLKGVERIDLVLDLKPDREPDRELVLRANGVEIHAEVAVFEEIEPLERILRHATARYGDRIASFDITAGAHVYLCGDSFSLVYEVDRIRTEYGFRKDNG